MAGLAWINEQWRYFIEYKPIKRYKGKERIKIKLGNRWVKVDKDNIKRLPEGK